MTKYKWIDFAGFLSECTHNMEHPECPFKQYQSMDQYQRLEFQMSISEVEANKMMSNCLCYQSECAPISFEKQESGWGLAVAI